MGICAQRYYSPSRSLLLLIRFGVLRWGQLQSAEWLRGHVRLLQRLVGRRLGLNGLLDYMMLGDGQDGRSIVRQLLGTAGRGCGGLDIGKEGPTCPLDHRGHQWNVLAKARSTHERLVALEERGRQGALSNLLRRGADHRDGDNGYRSCKWWRERQRRRWCRRRQGHRRDFIAGLRRVDGMVNPWHAGLLLLLFVLQAKLFMFFIFLWEMKAEGRGGREGGRGKTRKKYSR